VTVAIDKVADIGKEYLIHLKPSVPDAIKMQPHLLEDLSTYTRSDLLEEPAASVFALLNQLRQYLYFCTSASVFVLLYLEKLDGAEAVEVCKTLVVTHFLAVPIFA